LRGSGEQAEEDEPLKGSADVAPSMSLEGKQFTRRDRWTYEFMQDGKLRVTDKRDGDTYDGMYEQEGTSVTMVTGDRERMGTYDGKEFEFIRRQSPRYPGFYKEEIKRITMLGDDKELKWKRTNRGLVIETPAKQAGKYAYVFKIERFPHPKLNQ
jgi:hypothetical protein